MTAGELFIRESKRFNEKNDNIISMTRSIPSTAYILETIAEQNRYYVGGTLCVDFPHVLLLINLNETISYNFTDKHSEKYNHIELLGLYETTLAFLAYYIIRIEGDASNTKYFLEKLKASCIRHFFPSHLAQWLEADQYPMGNVTNVLLIKQELLKLKKRFGDKNQTAAWRFLSNSTYGVFGKKTLKIGDIMKGAEAIRKAEENQKPFRFATRDENGEFK